MTTTVVPTTHERRRIELRATMAQHGWAAVAATSPESVYYLVGLDHLGYFSFTMLIVPMHGRPVLVAREMERPTIRAQLSECGHAAYADGADAAATVAGELARFGGETVAVEEGSMFFPPSIRTRITAALPDVRWDDATSVLSAQRAVKSSAELEHMNAAAEVSDQAMAAVLATAGPGVAERDVAARAQAAMFGAGGQQPGFVPLIRPMSILDQEHVSWGDRKLRADTGLFVELSGCVNRYHAPLSRTIYLGALPDGAAEAHRTALTGLVAAGDALRPGARTGDVFDVWHRAVGGAVRHHCGYLVGIGFPPSWVGGGEVLGIRPGGTTIIEESMTFHLMSWVDGHVISDTAVIRADGAQPLTTTSRELTVLA